MGFKLGGDGEELRAFAHVVGAKLNVATHLITSAPVGFLKIWHHLIRSSSQGGGGKRASTDHFALELDASSQGVINCDCGG
jgi:hypothetical protein